MKIEFDFFYQARDFNIVHVRGLKKDIETIKKVTADLEKFINEELVKSSEPPREKVTTKCHDNQKQSFKVLDKLKALQA